MTTNRSSARCSTLCKNRLAVVAAWLIGACGFAACAAQQPGPFFGDEKFLVVGVDPDAEARSLSAQLEKKGFHVLRRLRGKTFTALGFGDDHDVPVKVRVVTPRGIELALDPVTATALQTGVRYELLDAPVAGTQDADSDGFEDVFVAVRSDVFEESCIQLYRVRDSGFVDAADGKGIAPPDAQASVWRELPLCEQPAQAEDAAEPATEPSPDAAPKAQPTPDAKPREGASSQLKPPPP